MEDENPNSLSLCDSCYTAADQEQASTRDLCDVCNYRSKLAEFRNLLSVKDGRIEDLEAQVDKLKQQLKDSESRLLDGIGIVDKGRAAAENGNGRSNPRNGSDTNGNGAVAACAEEAPPPDTRPHVMLVGDSLFGKLRKAPHFIYEHLGRIPRLLSRTKPDAGVVDMARNAIESLANEKVPERNFHILWFGGLHDTTLEDYERKSYFEKLVKSLTELRNHERVLSISWCTLPESAHNAEAREINELVTNWITETGCGSDQAGCSIRLVDLRYISRREGTMEVNEAMWTPKGSKLVSESLRKLLNEKLEFTQKELESIESSSKAMLEARERKEKNKVERKAKHEANLQEQQLRRQQKLAKQVLLRAGHKIPGSGAGSSAEPARNANGSGKPKPKTPLKPRRPRKGKVAPAVTPKRSSAPPDAFAAPKRYHQSDYPKNSEAFPTRENRLDSYFEGWGSKRSRTSNDETPFPFPFAATSDSYFRRDEYPGRSHSVSNSSTAHYDSSRNLAPNERSSYGTPSDQMRRLQWEAYDRLRP